MVPIAEHDRVAIEALFSTMHRAWLNNDADAYANCFEQQADYVAFDGTHVSGRAANRALHESLFASVLRDTRLVGGPPKLRMLTPDVVLVHSTGAVLFPWQKELVNSRLSIQTLVLVKREGRWLAAAFHNSRVKPVPIPEPGSFVGRAFAAYAPMRRALV